MRRHVIALLLACAPAFLPLAGCAGQPEPAPAAPAVEPQALVPQAQPVPAAPLAPRLALRAFGLATRGDHPAARALLAGELRGRVARADWQDETLLPDSVVATHLWRRLVRERERYFDTQALLDAFRPWPAATPPELARQLDLLYAECLRATGHVDEARALTRAAGHLTDFRIVGPFDNERGKGFNAKQPPEEALDYAATYRGKARDLAWRANPAPEHPLGRIVLSELLRPTNQGLAYLATALRADAALECALELSSSGPLAVFVNGKEVLKRKVERPHDCDQDVVAIALEPGWNRLVIKSGIEEGPDWIVGARLTDLAGRPLLLDVSSDQAPAARATGAAGRKAREKPAPRTRTWLEAHAGEDADAARLLTLLHLTQHPDDGAAKSAIKAVELALKREPEDPDTLYLAALAYAPEPGTTRAEMQVNPWIGPLKRLAARPDAQAAALCDLADFSLELNPLPWRAAELAARAHAAAPLDPRSLTVQVRALGNLGRAAEAEALGATLLDHPEHAWTQAGIAARAGRELLHGRPGAGLEILRAGHAAQRVPGAVWDSYLTRLGDLRLTDEIVAVAGELLAAAPFEVSILQQAAWRLELCDADAAAETLLQSALRIAPEDTSTLLSLARLAQRAGQLERSDVWLAEILRIDPGQDRVRRQRELLARRGEQRFEAPYVWDARARLAAAPAAGAGNEPLAVIDRTLVCLVNRDGTSSRYEHILWRVQNQGGARTLDRYGIFYPPGALLTVRALRILRANGTVEPVPAPRRGDGPGGGGLVRGYDLPPLSPGDALDVEFRIDETSPGVFGNYFGLRHEFYPDWPDGTAPTLRSELVLIEGDGVELYTHAQHAERLEADSTRDASGRRVQRWVAKDLERPVRESAGQRRSELAPRIDASTYADWPSFAAWWWSFIEKEFQSSPEMSAKVRELTAGLTTEREKIQAIARFVGQEIRYNAWAFGTHGYEPFSAPVIFERRFGDCKDKSILLSQMLGEIGVRAHPVLIKAESFRPVEPLSVAMVEHFNHCIAYLPATAERAGFYLDCTADKNPIDYLRHDDQGATVLHVDQGQGALHQIPFAPPAENQFVRRYEVTLDAAGDGTVTLADESNGSYGVGLRSYLGGETGDLEKRVANMLGESFAQVEIRKVETSDLFDIGVPARLEASFAAKKLWAREGDAATLRLTLDGLGIERAAAEPPETRTQDLVLDRPFAHQVTIRYRLPDGMRAASLPPRVEVREPGLLSYVQEVRAVEGGVEVARRFELEVQRVPLAQYAAVRDALRRIELAEQRSLRLEKSAAGSR